MAAALVVAVATAVALLVAFNGDDPEQETAKPKAPQQTTSVQYAWSEQIALGAYERSLSECADSEVPALAKKYKVGREDPWTVAVAVGRAQSKALGGGEIEARSGRDGCLQGFRYRRS